MKRLVTFALFLSFLAGPAFAATRPDAEPPGIDHILIEVKDLASSLYFYRDGMGLPVEERGDDYAHLRAGNLRIFLWQDHWNWSPAPAGPRAPQGMYPHIVIKDVRAAIGGMEKAGGKIVSPAEDHPYGTEGFIADPDGYVWSVISR